MTESVQPIDSVWDALEGSPAEAENMRIRSCLMMAIREFISSRNLTQSQAARLFKVTQPRISELQRGKINLFSIDRLILMLVQAGWRVDVTVSSTSNMVTSGANNR
ncbi:helix-turn-helix domain-containing protein [Pseudomonas sp. NPDC088368]|uniref:helix-turn-helix domain-containing protein n=1 Tax=Pseudomonas sp. NPDC088368 TaxID=3364453 RepID=UPI00381A2C3B